MKDTGFPTTPEAAFAAVQDMAETLGKSIIELCGNAKVHPSPVYRWRTNKRSYDVSIFAKIRAAFNRCVARRKRD